MKQYLVTALFALVSCSCAQLTTSDDEEAVLQLNIDRSAEAYLDCMRSHGDKYSAIDESAAIIAEAAGLECSSYVEKYRATELSLAEKKYLSSRYREKLTDERTAELTERGRNIIIQAVFNAKIKAMDATAGT